ncbi:MAG: hypothetical protein Q8P13_00515 [bacterium]|nr:hypothetical protein [bacterium]
MKKKLFFSLPIFAAYFLSASSTLAGDFPTLNDITDPLETKFGSGLNLGNILTLLLPTVIVLAGMVATLLLIWGGFKYMTAQGDPKAVGAARSTITGAIIGLLIILSVGVIGFIIQEVLHYNIFTGSVVP